MKQANATQGLFLQEQAIWLRADKYEAAVLPNIGANMVAFRDVESGCRFLREPSEADFDSFKERPIVHGIPVLFPPNRYEDGKFPWDGKLHQLPVNEARTGNHLHGFIHDIPWQVDSYGADAGVSRVTLSLSVAQGHSVYEYLPFTFRITLTYTLSADGLQKHLTVKNEGQQAMPCLIAFHTAVNAPFHPDSKAADYRFKLTIGDRWEMNDRMLPTGSFQPLSEFEQQMKAGTANPFSEAMDNHYTAAPQNGRNRMELVDTRRGQMLVYDVGTSYKQWMIWNNNATEGFFCPEPQVNLVNAPNMPAIHDQEHVGMVRLEPGELWEQSGRLYTRSVL